MIGWNRSLPSRDQSQRFTGVSIIFTKNYFGLHGLEVMCWELLSQEMIAGNAIMERSRKMGLKVMQNEGRIVFTLSGLSPALL